MQDSDAHPQGALCNILIPPKITSESAVSAESG